MPNRTRTKRKGKHLHQDAKPYSECPLNAHPSGRWCKKHNGTRYDFGKVDDGWKPALAGPTPANLSNTLRESETTFNRFSRPTVLSPAKLESSTRSFRNVIEV